jgi:hypothetical protein
MSAKSDWKKEYMVGRVCWLALCCVVIVVLQRRKNPYCHDDSRGSKVLARLIQRLHHVCSESLDYLHVIRAFRKSNHEVSA